MHNHWNNHLNLAQFILDRKPKIIVECGAGNGELTRKLADLLDLYHFELHVISDNKIEGIASRIVWHEGLSYEELSHFEDDSIDLCIIDTDHNFWTLTKELNAVANKIRENGLIAMHDVDTFYHNTGMALSYWDGKPYPKEEIEACAPYGSLGDALIDFLHEKKMNFRMKAWSSDSNGAALIEKRTEPIFAIVIPGPKAVFTKKETQNVAVLQAG